LLDLDSFRAWLSPQRDVGAIVSLFATRTFSNRADAACVLVEHADRWTMELAAGTIHDADSFARLRALGEQVVPLAEYVRRVAREYAGVDMPPRFQGSQRRRHECHRDFLQAALTCGASRRDNELLLTLRQRDEFELLVPVVTEGIARIDLERLSWMLEHGFHPTMLARAFIGTVLEEQNAEEARWMVVRTAKYWSASLVRVTWDDADRMRAIGARDCARASLTQALGELVQAYSAYPSNQTATSRDPDDVRLLVMAARVGLLGVPLDPAYEDPQMGLRSLETPFHALMLSRAKTMRPGDTADCSPVSILLQAPALHPRVEKSLSMREFRIHGPVGVLEPSSPAVDELLLLIRSPLISPQNAIVAVGTALNHACFGVEDSQYLSMDDAPSLRKKTWEWLDSLAASAPTDGSRFWHHQVMLALLKRLEGQETLYVDLLRDWLSMEPEVMLHCIQEQASIAPTAHHPRQLVLHLLALADSDALATCSFVNAAHHEYMPSRNDLERVLDRLVSSAGAAARARGLRLLEWMAAEYP